MVAYDPKKGSGSMGRTLFLFFSFFTYIVPCLLLGFIVYREVTDEKQKETEFISRIDHLAENRNWDAILQNVTPEMTKKNSSLLRWTLLALSEKGQLPERMFAYGVTEPACFFYERVDKQFCRNFNMQFFRALELDNELLHNAFQAGIFSLREQFSFYESNCGRLCPSRSQSNACQVCRSNEAYKLPHETGTVAG